MTTDLENAIRERRVIEFTYLRQPRVAQPAALGPHRVTGDLTLRAYQVGGRSNSRKPPLWILFTVDLMSDVRVSEQTFIDDPPGYHDGDAHIFPAIAEL